MPELPTFNLAQIEPAIAGTQFAGHVHHLATTPSTNTLALEAAQQNVATGVWIADEQTAGRGRGGHTWHSTPGDGLYVSILTRPRLFGADALKLSLAAGLAAHQAISQTTGADINLRWPNDLMLTGPDPGPDAVEKKFGGILTESSMEGGSSGALAYAVIGIGMNLNHQTLPPDLSPIATSLRIVLGHPVSREAILSALLRALESEIALLEAEASGTRSHNTAPLALRFGRASTWVRNLRVHVDEQGGYTGFTAGLDPQGLLQVRLDDGTTRTVRHGGVRRALPLPLTP
jgi:BirA family transcriptional regulator, biotin operon repressor / biotin---[acetyl-CoA-carboxylase] ligase